MKTQKEIEEMIAVHACDGVDFQGMSYKDGVNDGLRWVLEEMSDNELLFGDDDNE